MGDKQSALEHANAAFKLPRMGSRRDYRRLSNKSRRFHEFKSYAGIPTRLSAERFASPLRSLA